MYIVRSKEETVAAYFDENLSNSLVFLKTRRVSGLPKFTR